MLWQTRRRCTGEEGEEGEKEEEEDSDNLRNKMGWKTG